VSKTVLIDHRPCGGAGCKVCRGTGTATTGTSRPTGLAIRSQHFATDRERCPCFEGYPINADVAQCTHADHPDDGEFCAAEVCPLIVQG